MFNILLIAFGGAFGSSSRYLLSELIVQNFHKGHSFPVATIAVNILGSLMAGILYFIFLNYLENVSEHFKLMLSFGFLGGFTTFSAFSLDVLKLIHAGQIQLAIFYAFLSVILSILAIFLGFYISSLIAS